MPFIGKQPAVGSFTLLDSITTSATATYALTKNGDAFYPETARNLLVSLNGVTQAPEDAYTVSGSNIVFDSALTASDVIDYILVLGDVLDIGQPSDGTVGVSQMNSALYSENEFFALPTGTTAQRPASPANGYMRYNTTTDALEIYEEFSSSWINKFTTKIEASGGTETTITQGGVDYKVHTFTSSGSLTVTAGGEVEYLVVAGGAGGTSYGTGGAGGGGYRCSVVGESSGGGASAESKLNVSNGVYSITVGAGGTTGNNGSDSTFSTITSTGGGKGGTYSSAGNGTANAGFDGGCGGGGAGAQSGTGGYGGSGTSGQGYDGGNGALYYSYPCGGGGGGAGEAGSNAVANVGDGHGGDGVQSSIDGTATYRAGGGGAWGWGGIADGNAGLGGAGESGFSGTANTGGGGGGGSTSGGSGIVIIRYQI